MNLHSHYRPQLSSISYIIFFNLIFNLQLKERFKKALGDFKAKLNARDENVKQLKNRIKTIEEERDEVTQVLRSEINQLREKLKTKENANFLKEPIFSY